jgi:hypothetical protein
MLKKTNTNNTVNVWMNVTFGRVHVTIVTVEKQ